MRTVLLIFLVTANSLTSIIVIALGSSLFIFPNSEVSLELQSYTGIYVVFALLCFYEPVKWWKYKEAKELKHHNLERFFISYGIILTITSFYYQLYYFSLVGLLYIINYFIVRRIPQQSNVIVEKKVDGQALKSDLLFHPLPKETDNDKYTEK